MAPYRIERSIWIKARPERVWAALTDPAQVAQWFAPGVTFRSTGTAVGARLWIEDPETGGETFTQVITMSDPPRRLVMRSLVEPPEAPFTTSYRLEDEDGGTRLTLEYSGYEGLAEDVRRQLMLENTTGFELMLANIKAHVEGTPLPNPGGF